MVADSLEFLVAQVGRVHTQRGQRSPTGLGAYQSCQKTEKYPFKISKKKSAKGDGSSKRTNAEQFPQQTKSSAQQHK